MQILRQQKGLLKLSNQLRLSQKTQYNISTINIDELKSIIKGSRLNIKPKSLQQLEFNNVYVFQDDAVEKHIQKIMTRQKRKGVLSSLSLLGSAVCLVQSSFIAGIPLFVLGFGFAYGANIDKHLVSNNIYQMEILEDHEHVRMRTGKGTKFEKEIVAPIGEMEVHDIFDFRAQIDLIEKDEEKRKNTREVFSVMASVTDVNDDLHRNITFNVNANPDTQVTIPNIDLFIDVLDGQQDLCKKYSYKEVQQSKQQEQDQEQEEEEQQQQLEENNNKQEKQ